MKRIVQVVPQHNKVLYLTPMTAKELADEDRVKVDVWSMDNENGYQRVPTSSRASAYGRYVQKAKGISPTSVTLSARGEVTFDPKGDGFGELTIPDDMPLWIVDGQHRISGLRDLIARDPSFETYVLPVVIMPTYSFVEE